MTKSEAIYHRALRCRPAKRDAYVTTHEALLAEAEYMQRCRCAYDGIEPIYCCAHKPKNSLWQIIKGWFA